MTTDELARPPGIAASGMVKLHAAIGAATKAHADLDGAERRSRLAQEMTQAPLFLGIIPITAGSGVLGATDQAGPPTGYYWSVRRLQVQGFTAGSVIWYRNALFSGGAVVGTPEVLPPFPQSGVITAGRGEILLNPNDWMAFAATGITLAANYPGVQIQGTADSFPTWLLADYLM